MRTYKGHLLLPFVILLAGCYNAWASDPASMPIPLPVSPEMTSYMVPLAIALVYVTWGVRNVAELLDNGAKAIKQIADAGITIKVSHDLRLSDEDRKLMQRYLRQQTRTDTDEKER